MPDLWATLLGQQFTSSGLGAPRERTNTTRDVMTKAEVLEYLDQLQRLNLDSAATNAVILARGMALASAVALVLASDETELHVVTTSITRNMEATIADVAADDVTH